MKPPGYGARFIAAKVGRVETVRALLNGGADVDLADYSGHTPLFVAVLGGEVEVAESARACSHSVS